MPTKTYREPAALSDVAKFHETFDLPILDSPTIPDAARCELRLSLLQEELDELKAAIQDNDIVEIADALSDLQYVLSGAILEFGLGDRFAKLFAEVQRSNMSKTCKSMEEAVATQKHYRDTKNVESTITQKGPEYLVYRTPDRKVLKSIKYSAADLKSIVEEDE